MKKNEKDENGLYINLFELFITNPAGNTNPFSVIERYFAQDTECEYGSKIINLEAGVGVATTTQRILAECITREPIIDNGKLFNIIDVDKETESP